MSILDRWREARGNVMRKELEDAMARMRGANESARSAFFNNVDQTIGHLKKCMAQHQQASARPC